MTKHVVLIAIVCALGGTAAAQDIDDEGDGETPSEETTESSTESAPVATTTAEPAGGGEAGLKYGIEVDLNAVGEIGLLHALYNLGGHNYLDIGLGFDVDIEMPDEGDTETELAVNVLLGYRMYRALTGRIRPFLEPYLLFRWADNDALGNPLGAGVGGRLGVDFELFDQFTLGASLGAQLDFTHDDDSDDIGFALYTTAIAATFWW
jgi:hypothetical protein